MIHSNYIHKIHTLTNTPLQYHTYVYKQYPFYKIYSTCTAISIKVRQYSPTSDQNAFPQGQGTLISSWVHPPQKKSCVQTRHLCMMYITSLNLDNSTLNITSCSKDRLLTRTYARMQLSKHLLKQFSWSRANARKHV